MLCFVYKKMLALLATHNTSLHNTVLAGSDITGNQSVIAAVVCPRGVSLKQSKMTSSTPTAVSSPR